MLVWVCVGRLVGSMVVYDLIRDMLFAPFNYRPSVLATVAVAKSDTYKKERKKKYNKLCITIIFVTA